MDRLALLIAFGFGLGYGRWLDPQFRRDIRWWLAKRIHDHDATEKEIWEARKARAREQADG